jgi:hypothetical protein
MKVKLLAAAVAALGSAAALALPLVPATDTPDVVFYISGASAQKVAVAAIVPTTVFQTPADVVKITDGSSTGWFGLVKTGLYTGATTQKLLVVYNNTNGSAAGLNQLLSTAAIPTEAEAKNIKLPDATCVSAGASGAYTATCTGVLQPLETDMALSDVNISEFAPGALGTGAGYLAVSATTTVATGLEGFGVIVNKNLYSALQTQNVAEGFLPAACAPATVGAIVTGGACQPSIRSSDYATIATHLGAFVGAESAAVLPNVTAPLANWTLCRRDDLSGTQAASNIYFLNSVCGLKGYFGAQTPTTSADNTPTSTLTVVDAANNSTGLAESCTKNATGYALGVVSLGESDEADTAINYNGTKGFYFVKLDNVSPNFLPNGTLDALHRTSFMNANYHFATDMTAVTRNTIATPAKDIAASLQTALKNSALHNLTGIAYIDLPLQWGVDGKNAKFDRAGNNCGVLH